MKFNFAKKLKSLVFVILLGGAVVSYGQTINEAGEALNQGAELSKTDPKAAIASFQQCIDVASQLGEEGAELQGKAESMIVKMHYRVAMSELKAKKYDEAIVSLQSTVEVADKYNDAEIKAKATKYIPEAYSKKGSTLSRAKKYDEAIAAYNKAIELNGKKGKYYFGRGVVYKKMKNLDAMKTDLDKAIELSKEGDKVSKKCKSTLHKTYMNAGAKSIQKQKFADAAQLLSVATQYGASANAYYYQAVANNGIKKFDVAIEAANKALELEKEDKMRVYFQLGTSYAGLGDNGNACVNFKKVTAGPYVEQAKYQVEQVLKCK